MEVFELAKMIPSSEDDFNNSYGEVQVFNALRDNLPDEYTVFHSFRWNRRENNGRISWGEADYTVFHPDYGILIIEVKSGGIILSDGKWWYERLDNHQRYPMKDPIEQANRTKYTIVELLEGFLQDGDYCWIEPVVWFPSISDRSIVNDMPGTYHNENVFMEWALNNTKQAVENAYKFYDCERRTSISTESAELIVKKLAPEFCAIPSLSTIYHNQEYTFLRLTNEQLGLLDYLDEQPYAVIQGSAGTGKTLLAVEKARRLSADGKVLFLCYNRFLVDYLRNNNSDKNVIFHNLYSLAVREAGFSGIPADEDISDYLNNYDEYGKWDFKHIIVDEGQDFSDEHLNLLAAIAEIQNGQFYVFYDKNQLVQRRDIPRWIQESECRLVLRRNCRNTKKIATTSGKIIDINPVLWDKSPEGRTPNFYIYPDSDSLHKHLEELVDKYVSAGVPLNEITVLTVKNEEESLFSGLNSIGKHAIVKVKDEDGLLFTTIRKFKGLESAVVIIVDIDANTFSTSVMCRLFYVGTSRAKGFLDFMSVLDDEQLRELAESLSEGQSGKNAVAKIASKLKVRIHRE